jgi:hypothetical protein
MQRQGRVFCRTEDATTNEILNHHHQEGK